MIPMNINPQVTKSSPNPGGIGPPDSGPQNEAMSTEFVTALKGELKGADPGSGSTQSDAQPFNMGAQARGEQNLAGLKEAGKGAYLNNGEMGDQNLAQFDSSLKLNAVGSDVKTLQSESISKVTQGDLKSEPHGPRQSSSQLKRPNPSSRDESREALAGAAAQAIHPSLIPQLNLAAKLELGEGGRESFSKGAKFQGLKGQEPMPSEAGVLQNSLSSRKGLAKDSADSISQWNRPSAEGVTSKMESFSVDPRVNDLLSQGDLNVKSFELKPGAAAVASSLASSRTTESALPNRVSTEDFLSLRGAKKEKSPRGSMESVVGNPLMRSQAFGRLHLGPVLEAPVTHGTAGKPILSHDALNQITQQVSGFSQAKQDGEIKIRLKPDHLGELMMSVKTSGDKVAVQIKAQDNEAKKIIEDSLGRLKDSLSSQNLTLQKVDVVTQPSMSQSSDAGFQMDFGPQSQGNFGRNDSQQYRDSSSNSRQEFLYDERPVSSNLKSINPSWTRRSGGSGGLDLIA